MGKKIEVELCVRAYNAMMANPFMDGMASTLEVPTSIPGDGMIQYSRTRIKDPDSPFVELVKEQISDRLAGAAFLRLLADCLERIPEEKA